MHFHNNIVVLAILHQGEHLYRFCVFLVCFVSLFCIVMCYFVFTLNILCCVCCVKIVLCVCLLCCAISRCVIFCVVFNCVSSCCVVLPGSQGVVNLVVECLDRLHLYTSASNFAESVGGGGGTGEGWESLLNSFYQLLGQSAAVETTHFDPV